MFDFDDLRTLQAGLADLETRSGTGAVAQAQRLNLKAEVARARAVCALKQAKKLHEDKYPGE